VRGDGDNGFMAAIVGIARDKGVSGYVGDGSNRRLAVHRLDAAHLSRLAVEKVPTGSRLHAIDDEGVPIRAIAEVICRHLDIPVVAVAPEDAAELFGWLLSWRRQPGAEHTDPRTDGLAADASWPYRGSGEGRYFSKA
jgi:nucleoside-diphosphate-sugar epimerase